MALDIGLIAFCNIEQEKKKKKRRMTQDSGTRPFYDHGSTNSSSSSCRNSLVRSSEQRIEKEKKHVHYDKE